jgi:hypothetical protein
VLVEAGTQLGLQSGMVRVVRSRPESWTADCKTRALRRIGPRPKAVARGMAMKIEPLAGRRTSRFFSLISIIPCSPGGVMNPREPKPGSAESRDATGGKRQISTRTSN